ncbi:hypothetical protein GCM10018954_047350 [Kutzneria kofuensis]
MAIGIAFAAVAAGVSAPVTAAPAATSVLTKSAQDVTSPGANPVNHADTVNWVLSYANNGPDGPSAATITDPIAGAGTTQTYVPGSLQVPPGWTPSWSTDGTNYQTTDPGAATVSVRATNPGARSGGTNLANILLAPVKPTATATGGDGYSPIIFRQPNGTVEAWNMYHHLVAAAPKLVCTDLTAGAPCAGGPWPRPVNTAPGPFGSGSTGDIASTLTPQYVQDPGRPGVVYYAAVTASSVGVGCLDLGARANCGYFPLVTTGSGGAYGLAGLVATGGNLYGVGSNGQVLCLTIASQSPCPGQPYAAIVPANNNSPGANYLGVDGHRRRQGVRVVLAVGRGAGARLLRSGHRDGLRRLGHATRHRAGRQLHVQRLHRIRHREQCRRRVRDDDRQSHVDIDLFHREWRPTGRADRVQLPDQPAGLQPGDGRRLGRPSA